MKTPLRIAFALFSAAAAWASPQVEGVVPPERVFPQLDTILTRAAQQSPRMLARAIDLEIAENNRIQARAAVLPTVGGSYRIYQARDDRADQPKPITAKKSYYDFSITQPVFHWGERNNTKRIGEIQKAVAEGNYGEAYRALAQELRSKYLLLIIQKQTVKRAEAGLAYASQQVKLAEKRLAKADISELEMAPLRFSEEQGQLFVERSEFDYAQAKQTFARLSGVPELKDDEIPDEIPAIKHDAAAIDRLLADYLSAKEPPTVEAVNARRQIQVSELFYENEKTRLRPKFNFNAGANQDEQSFTTNVAQRYRVNSLYAGFSLNWQIFDGFTSQAATRSALARLRQARMDADETRLRLAQQAQQQAKFIYFSSRSMTLADRGLSGADALVQTRIADSKRGVATESDIAVAGIALIDARIAAYNARMEYFWRVSDFLGTLAADPVLSHLPTK